MNRAVWIDRINRWLSQRLPPLALAAVLLLLSWSAFLLYYHVSFGLDGPPGASGDETDYDSLGWELSRGNGYRLNTGDEAFRRPYEKAAKEDPLYELGEGRSGTITYRPPLFPAIVAAIDLVLGRQFWGIRLFNSFCMAALCGMLTWYVARRWGALPAVSGAFLFVAVDTRTRLFGRAILTEAPAALSIALLCYCLFAFARRRTFRLSMVAGLVFGLAVLARTLLILWLPGLLLIVAWLAYRSCGREAGMKPGGRGSAAAHCGVFLLTALVVLLPWMIRNCVVTGAFMPLGTQGQSQMSAAFSDVAWENGGRWRLLEEVGFFDEVTDEEMSLLEREIATARYSRARALEWVRENPGKAFVLFPMKISHEFRPRAPYEAVLLLLALLGAWRLRADLDGGVLLALVATNAFAIGVTWSVEGRFLVPLLFVQHVLAVAGLWGISSTDRRSGL